MNIYLKGLFKVINSKKFLFGVMTFLTSFGGFPEPPKFFEKITESIIMKYLFLLLLIIQGGAEGHILTSILTILICGSILELIKYIESKINEKNYT